MTIPTPFPGNTQWPSDWQGARVKAQYLDELGVPLKGSISFKPVPAALLSSGQNKIILPAGRAVTLDNEGRLDILLPATDDPDINPSGWTYRVEERVPGGRTYAISAPMHTTTDLADVAPVASSPGNAIVKGDKGDQGNPGEKGDQGDTGEAGSYAGTKFGSGVVNGVPYVTVTFSPWGIDGDGVAYYDPDGVPADEAGVPVFLEDGTTTVVRPNGAIT